MQEGWNPPRCTFLQPFTYVIFFPPPSPPTESSQCDNRGIISSGSRPCSCKVRTEPAELIQRYIRTIYNFFFPTRWLIMPRCLRWPGRDLIHVVSIFFCPEQRGGRSVQRVQGRLLPPVAGQPRGLPPVLLHGRHQAVQQLLLEQRPGTFFGD